MSWYDIARHQIYRQATYISKQHISSVNTKEEYTLAANEALTESYYYILLCLYKEPMHGYGIMQETQRLSDSRVKIGSGTMYGATGSMIKKGWIEEVVSDTPGYERKRLYRLTEKGKKVLEEEIARLKSLVKSADEIVK